MNGAVNKDSYVIGILGVTSGVGTTHLSIMIGNYLANILGKTVALLELNKNNTFSRLANLESSEEEKSCININGIDFYQNIVYEDILQIMTNRYNYVVLDISNKYILGKNEFLRSHKKIIIGSLSKWKIHDYFKYLDSNYLALEKTPSIFLSLTKDSLYHKKIQKKYGITVKPIPFEENPFYLQSKNLQWIQELLK